jgi:DNA gyrase subunit A
MEDVVFEEKKAPAQPVVILMDKFGYIRAVEASVYERNKEAADSENKYIIPCMSDTKLCVFTVGGMMHQIKVEAIPLKKFREKGVPIDNISNYNSQSEQILAIMTESDFTTGKKLLFTTNLGMMKQVSVLEFIVAKKLVAATKLNDGDELVSIQVVEPNDMVVLKTKAGFFLKFASAEVPEKKKGAVGVRGIKLQSKDRVENVYLYTDGVETKVMVKDKEVTLNRLKTAQRDGTGIKQR